MHAQGLYDPSNEHDACGVGFIAHIKGKKNHAIVEQGLLILKNLDHRGAVGADPLMGDGAGILIQIPDQYYREEMAKQNIQLPPPGEYGVGMIFCRKSMRPVWPVSRKSSAQSGQKVRLFWAGAMFR
jgi:glutamate synthase (NADPH/NADH) large chain